MATRTRKAPKGAKQAPRSASLPMLSREARIESVDEEARTVEVVWTTGATVRRGGGFFSDPFQETLSLETGAVRMGRMESGRMSVMESHGSGSRWSERPLDGVLGVVVTGSLKPKREGRATLRFSRSERAEERWRDVVDGIIRNVSVGYVVHKFRDVTEKDSRERHLLAIDWEPVELSLVAVPADGGAGVRGTAQGEEFACEIVSENRSMEEEEEENTNPNGQPTEARQQPPSSPPAPQPAQAPAPRTPSEPAARDADLETARAEGARLERARVVAVRSAVTRAGLDSELAEALVTEGVSIEVARERIIDAIAERSEEDGPQGTRTRVQVGADRKRDGMRAAIVTSLLHRARPADFELTDQAREFRGHSLLDIGREILEARGERTRGLDRMDLAKRAMQSSSDFPAIVADVANQSLRRSYEEAPRTWGAITSETTARDFKPLNPTQLSAAPDLDEVNEHGEFRHGALLDGKETYAVASYGKIVALTRKALVNDDLSAFTRIPRMFAQAAARKQADVIWGLVTTNGLMADGNALFSANHANTGTQVLTDETDLQELVALLRKQTGLQGEVLNLGPANLIVGTALELKARRLTADISPRNQGDVNPWASSIQPVIEPRLDANPTYWYLAASTGQVDIIEVAYLDGARIPVIETRNGFDVDGVEIKCRYDFGAGPLDHRGIARSNGSA